MNGARPRIATAKDRKGQTFSSALKSPGISDHSDPDRGPNHSAGSSHDQCAIPGDPGRTRPDRVPNISRTLLSVFLWLHLPWRCACRAREVHADNALA